MCILEVMDQLKIMPEIEVPLFCPSHDEITENSNAEEGGVGQGVEVMVDQTVSPELPTAEMLLPTGDELEDASLTGERTDVPDG